MYIDKLDNVVNKYKNICNRIIKMKHGDVQPSKYIDLEKEKK